MDQKEMLAHFFQQVQQQITLVLNVRQMLLPQLSQPSRSTGRFSQLWSFFGTLNDKNVCLKM